MEDKIEVIHVSMEINADFDSYRKSRFSMPSNMKCSGPRKFYFLRRQNSKNLRFLVYRKYVAFSLTHSFDSFTQAFEGLLGKFDRSILKEADFHKMEKCFKEMSGEKDLMLFQVLDHGDYLNVMGLSKRLNSMF